MGAFQVSLGVGSVAGSRLGAASHMLCEALLLLGALIFCYGLYVSRRS